MNLRIWLEEKREEIAQRWGVEIRGKEGRRRDDTDGFFETYLDSMLFFLSRCHGADRELGEEAWQQGAYLYGTFALQRGLAAGEVIEELQLLRDVILRKLMEAPTLNWHHRGFQRDLLALNRTLDSGVVQASVAYVDDLFFAHLQGSGVPEHVTPGLEEEMSRQLEAFRRDLGEGMR